MYSWCYTTGWPSFCFESSIHKARAKSMTQNKQAQVPRRDRAFILPCPGPGVLGVGELFAVGCWVGVHDVFMTKSMRACAHTNTPRRPTDKTKFSSEFYHRVEFGFTFYCVLVVTHTNTHSPRVHMHSDRETETDRNTVTARTDALQTVWDGLTFYCVLICRVSWYMYQMYLIFFLI